MTVNAKDILDAAKVRLNALTKAYEQGDYETFKSLAETSFIAGDEEINFPVPVLDDRYHFKYKEHKFVILNSVLASNDKLRHKNYENILTDRATIWEVTLYDDDHREAWNFVNWLPWEFDNGMAVNKIVLHYINEYLEQKEEQYA